MQKRFYQYDLLRIIASFLVIVIHVAAYKWYITPASEYNWQIYNLFNGISRMAVPLFIMISGFFILSTPEEELFNKIKNRYIPRTLFTLIGWSFLYACYNSLIRYRIINAVSIRYFIKNFMFGSYHLWFLYMLLGLYLITPILKKLVKDKKILTYFLILSGIMAIIIPSVTTVFKLETITLFIEKFGIYLPLGYTFYYMLGYYLGNNKLTNIERKVIYIIGLCSIIATPIFTYLYSIKLGANSSLFYNYNHFFVAMTTIAVFYFFKNMKISDISSKYIPMISKHTFTIYLVHLLVLDILFRKVVTVDFINPIVSIPLLSLIIFILSLLFSIMANKIIDKFKRKNKQKKN